MVDRNAGMNGEKGKFCLSQGKAKVSSKEDGKEERRKIIFWNIPGLMRQDEFLELYIHVSMIL